MLSFEELAVMLSLDQDYGMLKSDVAFNAKCLYETRRFDGNVALGIIDNLVGIDFVSKDKAGFLYLTANGKKALAETKTQSKKLIDTLMYGNV
jgi:hypothetical protein